MSSTDARGLRTRAALRAAIIALAQEQGFESLTVRAIAARAGIGYATFFRHYPDKGSLLADASEDLIRQFVERLSPMVVAGQGAAAMTALASFVADNRPLCRALLIGGGDAVRAEVTRRALLLAGQGATAAPHWLPRDLAVTHVVRATLNILAWWLQQETPLAPAEMAAILDRLVIAPLDLAAGAEDQDSGRGPA